MPKATTADGVEIHFETRGTGPINLMMLHGWGGVGGLWFQVARHLDEHQFCSFLIDSRGHGRSAASSGRYAWDDFVSDVLAVAKEAGAERFVPVGSSLGGKLSLYLTAKHPDAIPAQILVTPVGPGPSPLSLESRRGLYKPGDDWTKLRDSIRHWFGPNADPAIIDACCRAVARSSAPMLETTAQTLLTTHLPQPYDRTDRPTLVVIGEHDPLYGPQYQREQVLPFLSSATTATLPSGHFPPLEHPRELAALIADFATAHWTPANADDNLRP